MKLLKNEEVVPSLLQMERESEKDLDRMTQAFRKRKETEDERFADATESHFWCCLGFQNPAMLKEFLQKTGWEKFGVKYIDGMKVQRNLVLNSKHRCHLFGGSVPHRKST